LSQIFLHFEDENDIKSDIITNITTSLEKLTEKLEKSENLYNNLNDRIKFIESTTKNDAKLVSEYKIMMNNFNNNLNLLAKKLEIDVNSHADLHYIVRKSLIRVKNNGQYNGYRTLIVNKDCIKYSVYGIRSKKLIYIFE